MGILKNMIFFFKIPMLETSLTMKGQTHFGIQETQFSIFDNYGKP